MREKFDAPLWNNVKNALLEKTYKKWRSDYIYLQMTIVSAGVAIIIVVGGGAMFFFYFLSFGYLG